MDIINVPTSRDIYIEINGKKVALVQSYRVKTTKESRNIEEFGSTDPVGIVEGKTVHNIELSKIYVCDGELPEEINLYTLRDFNLVIVKPDRHIIYDGCEWTNITESAELSKNVYENVSLIAAKRYEIKI